MMSESTTFTTWYLVQAVSEGAKTIPIGRPIANTHCFLLDEHLQPVPIGVPGELYIGGDGLAQGYLNRPDLTSEKFIPNPFNNSKFKIQSSKLYKTGDLARYLPNGNIEYLGRIDNQVKLRGFRIELGEIEAVLATHPQVQETTVIVREDIQSDKRLVAYVVPKTETEPKAALPTVNELRSFLKSKLPDYMMPNAFVILKAMPLTPNGKVDRRNLPIPDHTARPDAAYIMPQTKVEQIVAAVWQEMLHVEKVGIYDNFFELGGHSLLVVQVHHKLQEILGVKLSVVEMFQYPTIHSLSERLSNYLTIQDASKQSNGDGLNLRTRQASMQQQRQLRQHHQSDIAIIAMSGQFPQAQDIDSLWNNLCNGIESISFFSEQEMVAEGVNIKWLNNPKHVRASGVLSDIELFDAYFFGYSPKEAELIDPQQRLFLECAWSAIEKAGYDPENYKGLIGVYAGCGGNDYLLKNLYPNRDILELNDFDDLSYGNAPDHLATRVSYKLNLTGPALNIQTACSTSLVAVHLGCQSLLNGECDMAIAGGVSIHLPQKTGYLYQEGLILSPDGHCRAFDAKAKGTVGGNGVGIVVLKRLADAIADGDYIHAVIKGSSINNDGSLKVGYTAPSIDGQAAVISQAQAVAGIDPETITYIEAHGTATGLGDPIEIAALTQAFRASTQNKGFCAIGSLKTNIGHLNTAAGVAGLIKTVLSLKHKLLPPSLHFEQPNPDIDFANSPFYVNTKLSQWETNGTPRRAGVSSFGMGGTNAHVVLEETPAFFDYKSPESGRKFQLLVLSAKTESALDTATANLVEHLTHHPDINLTDVAYTLGVGRKAFNHRRILVCRDREDAVNTLSTQDPKRIFTNVQEPKNRPVAFMFSGQGSQYVNMAGELYQEELVFREQIDLCAELLKPHLGLDLRNLLYPSEEQAEQAAAQLNQTAIAQPALFTIEYALAKLWMSWGVHPKAAIGHSIGEYVAATLAGVFSLEEALSLVAARGQLTQQMPPGSMLAVPLSQQQVQPLLNNELSLAAINGSSLCTVSGATDAIEALQQQLQAQGVECRLLHTSHAFHSYMMEPILETFTEQVKKVNLKPPQIPYISNVTGTWITAEEATNPSYWARHLRQTVLFSSGLQRLLQEQDLILLEVGPGRTLSAIAKKHVDNAAEQVILSSVRHPQDQQSDVAFLLNALGRLWLAGIQVDWAGFYAGCQRHRLPLPTYPFERQRYWISPPKVAGTQKELNSHTVCPDDAVKTDVETLDTKSPKKDLSSLHATRPNLPNPYVAPRSQMERTLTEIWQKFFGIEQVGIHDDFFELGGDSLLAVHLISKLCETLKIELSPHSLLGSPTIARFAELIEQTASPAAIPNQPALPSSLVEIKSGSFKQPLFLIHPVGGHVYIYRDLANCLGSDYPVYGLQAQGIDGKTQPLTQVEEMATKYIEALRVVQPNGPYFLGGSSFGGTVAFEMAQQFLAVGEEVGLLALIDTPGLGQMPVKIEDDELQILTYILNVGANVSFSSDHLRQLEPDERLLHFLEQAKQSMRLPPDYGLSDLRFFFKIFKVDVQAMRNYTPQIYPGRVIFFRANQRDATNPQNPELAWVNLAGGGLEVHEVPGNHITMNYAPNVQVIAERLRTYLLSLSVGSSKPNT